MTMDRELNEILAEIGREHRAMGAPESLEAALRAAAESRQDTIGGPRLGTRGLRLTWVWATAAILLAAIATSGAIWQMRKAHRPQDHEVRSVPAPPSVRLEMLAPSRRAATAATSVPVRGAAEGRPRFRDLSARRARSTSLDEFVALPVSEGLPPAADLSVVRITLRGSDLQQYGLEAPADAVAHTMLAEFVVGEDGLPRAIRIVR